MRAGAFSSPFAPSGVGGSASGGVDVSATPDFQAFTGDGTATAFTLDHSIAAGFAAGAIVHRRGLGLVYVSADPGAGEFTASGDQVVLGEAPRIGDSVTVHYWR